MVWSLERMLLNWSVGSMMLKVKFTASSVRVSSGSMTAPAAPAAPAARATARCPVVERRFPGELFKFELRR
jgi:hypothetical protein